MTRKIAAAFIALLSMQALAIAQNNQVMNVVEITKIDSKKMTLSVKSDLADGASRSSGAPAVGGRGGARGGYRAGGGFQTRQFKVYVTKETTLKEGGTSI